MRIVSGLSLSLVIAIGAAAANAACTLETELDKLQLANDFVRVGLFNDRIAHFVTPDGQLIAVENTRWCGTEGPLPEVVLLSELLAIAKRRCATKVASTLDCRNSAAVDLARLLSRHGKLRITSANTAGSRATAVVLH